MAPLVFTVLLILSFHVLSSYIYVLLSLVAVPTVWVLLNFMTAPSRRCKAKKGTFSCDMKEYITARQLESHCKAVFQDCCSPDMIHYQRWSQHLMLSETFVSLPYNKLFHFDIFVKQKQKAYSCFSLLNQWKNLCQLIAWILSNSSCL